MAQFALNLENNNTERKLHNGHKVSGGFIRSPSPADYTSVDITVYVVRNLSLTQLLLCLVKTLVNDESGCRLAQASTSKVVETPGFLIEKLCCIIILSS